MKHLTIKQALEQGYTHYGHFTIKYFQRMKAIDKLSPDNIPDDAVLFDKTPSYTPIISSAEIADIIADVMAETCASETGEDDSDEIYDTVKALDFSSAAQMINDALNHKKYYPLTDIILLP